MGDTVDMRGQSCCVVANVLDCSMVVSEFELQSCYYVHFRTNTLGEKYETLYPLRYGFNSITAVLLLRWYWH